MNIRYTRYVVNHFFFLLKRFSAKSSCQDCLISKFLGTTHPLGHTRRGYGAGTSMATTPHYCTLHLPLLPSVHPCACWGTPTHPLLPGHEFPSCTAPLRHPGLQATLTLQAGCAVLLCLLGQEKPKGGGAWSSWLLLHLKQ